MSARFYEWVDRRLNLKPLVRSIADHPVPRNVTFWHCFGGITFTVICVQILTGIFLTMYYVPSPDHAYASVNYITNEVTFGRVVRGMHRIGASMAVVTLVIHMMRVYFMRAYRNPRELNWLAGLGLLTVVLGFGFTGYLLPWDQKAYWATVVGTNIAGAVPGVGPWILKLMRGGTDLGAVTLARFYALHIWFLPAGLVVLLVAHFFMVRRQGIARPL